MQCSLSHCAADDVRTMKSPSIFKSLGPAIIVASIVLGPGSVLTSSKVGCQYGYQMLWVIAGASLLMIGMTAFGAILGACGGQTPCEAVAQRFGRSASVAIGLVVFLIVVCFQSGNNIAVLASLGELVPNRETVDANVAAADSNAASAATFSRHTVPAIILIALNGLVGAALFGMKRLYRSIERFMLILVLVMLAGFSANLMFARPSLLSVLRGMVPALPAADGGNWFPRLVAGNVVDPYWALQGLIATTLSIVGAFYQSYLVREKGWAHADVKRGMWDSILGIALLGTISSMVMVTSAAALHGKIAPDELSSAADVARQLEPLFGQAATTLFALGIFAAAFSSFLGNALIGGTILSDGLGWGSSLDGLWPKRLTVVALAIGMTIAVAATTGGFNTVQSIVFAQALSVLGVPVLAALMIWQGLKTRRGDVHVMPRWVLAVACLAAVVTTFLAMRTAWRLVLTWS